jgi:hypothetical protein
MSRRRLAVGAGHSNHSKTLARMTVEIRREFRERKACVRDLDDRDVDAVNSMLGNDGDRAALHCLSDELRAIRANAFQRDKHLARTNRTRVVRDAGNRTRSLAGCDSALDVGEFH